MPRKTRAGTPVANTSLREIAHNHGTRPDLRPRPDGHARNDAAPIPTNAPSPISDASRQVDAGATWAYSPMWQSWSTVAPVLTMAPSAIWASALIDRPGHYSHAVPDAGARRHCGAGADCIDEPETRLDSRAGRRPGAHGYPRWPRWRRRCRWPQIRQDVIRAQDGNSEHGRRRRVAGAAGKFDIRAVREEAR